LHRFPLTKRFFGGIKAIQKQGVDPMLIRGEMAGISGVVTEMACIEKHIDLA
jgi:hypothetical protein